MTEIRAAEYTILQAILLSRWDSLADLDANEIDDVGVRSVVRLALSAQLISDVKTFNKINISSERRARNEMGCRENDSPTLPVVRAIDVIHNYAVKKTRERLAASVADAIKDGDIPLANQLIKEIEAISLRSDGIVSRLSDNVYAALQSISHYAAGDYSDRIPIGIEIIDKALRGGLMPGALYLLGAPSGHGKTTLLQCAAFNCARTRGPALFVSPEMSMVELAEREIVRVSGIPLHKRGHWVHPNDRVPAEMAHEEAAKMIASDALPVHIVEDMNITMEDVSSAAGKIDGLRLIIVDYAQEIAARDSNMARYLAVGEVGKDAIAMGRKLNCPVIVASQVNVFKTDSGSLEYAFRETKDLEHRAHASLIMEVKRSKQANKHGYHNVESTRIFARKNRSGPLFSCPVDYQPELFRIGDHKEEPWSPPPAEDLRGGY